MQTDVISRLHVRRGKALVDCGWKSARELFAPPGSNRLGGGGNEAIGASGVEGHVGDLASMPAVTRVNAEQASKRLTQETTRRVVGRAAADGTVRANEAHQTCRGNGAGQACKVGQQHEAPAVIAEAINRQLARVRLGRVGWRERSVVPKKPGDAGGGNWP
jgi:hypothetical protein